jgi:hypothetical protein
MLKTTVGLYYTHTNVYFYGTEELIRINIAAVLF